MVTMSAPLHKNDEVTKHFMKASQVTPPPYIKSLGVYATYGDEGYKYYNIIEIRDQNLAEGLKELIIRLMPFDNIEGFKIKIENLVKVRAGIELMRELGKL